MKALLLPVLLAVLALPAAAQVEKTDPAGGDTTELKKRFQKQRPDGAGQAAGEPPGAAAKDAPEDKSTDELEALLIQTGWKKNAADNDKMSDDLKKTHRILQRNDPVYGLEYLILVPKEVTEGRQLVYRSVLVEGGAPRNPPILLKRVRAAGHLLVLEFDQQQQYLSLKEPERDNGFKLKGFTHNEGPEKSVAARQFSDADAFLDALKNQIKTDADKASAGLAERVKTVSGGKPFVLEAYVTKKGLVVLILTGGQAHQLYPDAPAAPPAEPKGAKPR